MLKEVYIKLLEVKLSILDTIIDNEKKIKDDYVLLELLNDTLKECLNRVETLFKYFELALTIEGKLL